MYKLSSNSQWIDIVFITYLHPPSIQDNPELYTSLRLTIEDFPATIPILKSAALGMGTREELLFAAEQEITDGMPPVLTPILLQEAMARRGVRMEDITFLDADFEKVKGFVEGGMGFFALSTTWTSGMQSALYIRDTARRLKALAPDIPVVVGGIGIKKALKTRELMQQGYFSEDEIPRLKNEYLLLAGELDGDIDAAVVSDKAENVLAEIADCIRKGKDFRDLPGLAIPENGDYRFTRALDGELSLDTEFVDWRNQSHRLKYHAAPIRTASGCPFKCGFCDFFALFKVRLRSTESLMAELRTLAAAKPPPRQVFFADDNIAVNKKRLKEITSAVIAENLQLAWRAFIRADSIDEETADLMRRSGCRECVIGVESGDPDILKAMNKKMDPSRAVKAVELLDRRGIHTLCTFVVGYPGECEKSIERTAQFISSLPNGDGARAIHRFQLFRFYLVSLCPAASREKRAEVGLRGIGDNWRHNTMSSEEAVDAMRDIFANVKKTPLMYLETLPIDWDVSDTRRVMTLRDDTMRRRLGKKPEHMDILFKSVRDAVSGRIAPVEAEQRAFNA